MQSDLIREAAAPAFAKAGIVGIIRQNPRSASMTAGCCFGGTGARFPKFAHRGGYTILRTSGSSWARAMLLFPCRLRFEVPGSNLPLAVQGLQIGGTGLGRESRPSLGSLGGFPRLAGGYRFQAAWGEGVKRSSGHRRRD